MTMFLAGFGTAFLLYVFTVLAQIRWESYLANVERKRIARWHARRRDNRALAGMTSFGESSFFNVNGITHEMESN